MKEIKAEELRDYENVLKLASSISEPIRISGSEGDFFIMSEKTRAHERWIANIEAAIDCSERQFADGDCYTLDEVIEELNRDIFKHEHI